MNKVWYAPQASKRPPTSEYLLKMKYEQKYNPQRTACPVLFNSFQRSYPQFHSSLELEESQD